MTPHEKTLTTLMDERLFEPSVLDVGTILRITGIRDDWLSLALGSIIGIDYTRIDGFTEGGKPKSETAVLVKRRGEMTTLGSILTLNRELRTGFREPTPESVIRDVLGGLYLADEKATVADIAARKAALKAARAEKAATR